MLGRRTKIRIERGKRKPMGAQGRRQQKGTRRGTNGTDKSVRTPIRTGGKTRKGGILRKRYAEPSESSLELKRKG